MLCRVEKAFRSRLDLDTKRSEGTGAKLFGIWGTKMVMCIFAEAFWDRLSTRLGMRKDELNRFPSFCDC